MLDDTSRYHEVRRRIEGKPSLNRFYREVYHEYQSCLKRCPQQGIALELGSGAGFAKQIIPSLVTSDILSYEGVDQVIDGTNLPFVDCSLRMVCMMNVLHHIADVGAFLCEAQRCLVPGGRIFIADQHVGLISKPILRYLHHEPFLPDAKEWSFGSTGALSDANGALAWIVFDRDQELFKRLYPLLNLCRYQPFAPLRYWLAGGLKRWSMLPQWAFGIAKRTDQLLISISPRLGSFVYIEVVKQGPARIF